MSYNKIITYGSRFEFYRYTREPSLFRGKRKSKINDVLPNSGNDRSNVLGLQSEICTSPKTKRQDNAKRAQMAFRRLVISNLQGSENPLLVTFTYARNQREISEGLRDLTTCFKALRYKCGKSFRYISVPEFQRRGAIHFHTLLWGVRQELLGIPRQWPSNSINCFYWDFGFVFVKSTDGNEKISTYLSKYMYKSFLDSRLAGKKAFASSRNVFRPEFYSGISDLAVDYLKDDYLGVDNSPLIQKEYMTQYLGSCNYQRFNIK